MTSSTRRPPARVAVLYGAVGVDAPADEQDVLVEVDTVRRALDQLGYVSVGVPITLDLEAGRRRLLDVQPTFVFNLVESIDGLGSLAHLAQSLLNSMGLPYTGAGSDAAFMTSNKLIAKRLLAAAGIPTPPWIQCRGDDVTVPGFRGPYIIKPVWEHASIGIDDDSIIVDPSALPVILRRRRRDQCGDWFVERFIDGREFNLSLLTGPSGVEVLPPAEIRFVDYAAGKPAIVGYDAKWREDSFEYRNTPRSFDLSESEEPLLDRLAATARVCWQLFSLRGYARVDYRVDAAGQPWVIDINTNPCLSPDAGFAAAAARAGLDLPAAVRRIVAGIPGDAAETCTEQDMPRTLRADPFPAAAGALSRLAFRDEVTARDTETVREMARATGFFSAEEVAVAAELVEARLTQGEASGYAFCFVERDGRVLGYVCFGGVPLTRSSYDLYWIVVCRDVQRLGIGRLLLGRAESTVAALGGTALYIETSSRPQHAPTRAFYQAAGYREIAVFKDFYGPGDSKIVYEKRLTPPATVPEQPAATP